MLLKRMKKIAQIIGIAILLMLALIGAVGKTAALYMSTHVESPVYSLIDDVPHGMTALVLGAGLSKDGRPNKQLRERLDAAVVLYKSGKVSEMIVSGNSATERGDEPGEMRDYLVARGVAAGSIVVDPEGVRTYESIYRAIHVYHLKTAVIVTHRYHLRRSLFLSQELGLDAVGFNANVPGESYWRSEVREQLSCVKALIDVYVSKPNPNRKDSAAPVMN